MAPDQPAHISPSDSSTQQPLSNWQQSKLIISGNSAPAQPAVSPPNTSRGQKHRRSAYLEPANRHAHSSKPSAPCAGFKPQTSIVASLTIASASPTKCAMSPPSM